MTEIPVEPRQTRARRVGAGHTTRGQGGISDQQGAVPLEDRRSGRAEFGVRGRGGEIICWCRAQEEDGGGRRQGKLVLSRDGHGGRSRRSGRRIGRTDTAATILAAATGRFRLYGNAAARRAADRKGQWPDEQQAEDDGGELFHDAAGIISWPEPRASPQLFPSPRLRSFFSDGPPDPCRISFCSSCSRA